jgi:hypothetical protein
MTHLKIAILSKATGLSLVGFFVVGSLLLPAKAQAQSTIFTDNFDQGLEKWQPTRDDGSLWKVVNGQATVIVETGSTITELVPKDQYWPTGSLEDFSYELDFTPVQGVDRNISFVYQNTLNWYEIHFVERSVNLVRLQNGIPQFNVFAPFTLQNNQTYHLQIVFHQGRVQLFMNGQKVMDESDYGYNHLPGKIGLKAGTGSIYPTEVRFDNVVVKSLPAEPLPDGIQLNVGLLKQSDPLWKDLEYDSASKWSDKTTIERWGCALTSMVMIMKYHQILKFPNGQDLSPANLNDWLKSQPDGYLAEGALNWLAVTRLTRLINQAFGTMKLEYSVDKGDYMYVENQIKANRPVILQIAGHFLVGSGITRLGQDIHIKDPAYNYSLFSQHHTPLLSVRKFTPSQTDLSYFLLAHSSNIQVVFYDSTGMPVLSAQKLDDQITDPVEPAAHRQTPSLTQIIIPKPSTDLYRLVIKPTQPGPYQFSLYLYDQVANVTIYKSAGLLGSEPRTFQITYNKNNPSKIQMDSSFAQLRQDLLLAKQQHHFNNYWLFDQMDRLISYALPAPKSVQLRYLAQLQAYWNQVGSSASSLGKQFILDDLNALQATLTAPPSLE